MLWQSRPDGACLRTTNAHEDDVACRTQPSRPKHILKYDEHKPTLFGRRHLCSPFRLELFPRRATARYYFGHTLSAPSRARRSSRRDSRIATDFPTDYGEAPLRDNKAETTGRLGCLIASAPLPAQPLGFFTYVDEGLKYSNVTGKARGSLLSELLRSGSPIVLPSWSCMNAWVTSRTITMWSCRRNSPRAASERAYIVPSETSIFGKTDAHVRPKASWARG